MHRLFLVPPEHFAHAQWLLQVTTSIHCVQDFWSGLFCVWCLSAEKYRKPKGVLLKIMQDLQQSNNATAKVRNVFDVFADFTSSPNVSVLCSCLYQWMAILNIHSTNRTGHNRTATTALFPHANSRLHLETFLHLAPWNRPIHGL